MALAVAASIGAVQLLADERSLSAGPLGDHRKPRFFLTVGRAGGSAPGTGPAPWFQVQAFERDGRTRPVDSVRPPSSAGEAQEIIEAPGGTFVIASSKAEPCESRLYRFRLTGDGHVEDIEPLGGNNVVPARVAGLAMSPDGDRLAYTTAPCTDDPPALAAAPRADLAVLDIDSGRRRTWSTAAPSVIGEIVWAGDDRTLGYAISDVSDRNVRNVTVYAADADAPGADLRGGRVLFRQPDASARVVTTVMSPDGRTGYGVLKKDRPRSMVFFSFAEGEPMRVTQTIRLKQNALMSIGLAAEDGPRYACLNGLDAFGRVLESEFTHRSNGSGCGSAYAY